MNFLRKLELSCGVVTGLVAMLVLLLLVREDQQAAQHLERDFPLYRSVVIGSLLFVIPSLLVIVGSYVHTVRKNSGGQVMLLLGAVVNVIVFLLFFFRLAFYRLDFSFWVNFSLPVFAILTFVVSLLAGRKR